MARGLIDRALRLGEGRQFKEYEQAVEAINRFEPEKELFDDSELRAEADELRERAREAPRRSTTCCRRRSRSAARPASGRSASATSTSS